MYYGMLQHVIRNLLVQALYVTYNPDGDKFKLPYCIIVFGFVQFLMSQLPDLHSLRFLNALSNFCTLAFSTIAVGMSIHNGESPNLWLHFRMYCWPISAFECVKVVCPVRVQTNFER